MHLFIYNVCTVTPVLKTETCKYLKIFHKIHTVTLKSIQTDTFSNYIKCFCNHGNIYNLKDLISIIFTKFLHLYFKNKLTFKQSLTLVANDCHILL